MNNGLRFAALLLAPLLAVASAHAAPPAAKPVPIEREFHLVVTVDATQDWKKNDPEYPGEQWSKGSTQQRYEIRTRLRSDGILEVRNLLDPDLNERLLAKTIHLARQAKKRFDAAGKPFKVPTTPAEIQTFNLQFQRENIACAGNAECLFELNLNYAAFMAAMQHPEYLEEEDVPGRYQYFLPYTGCPESSRVTMTMAIDGVRYNKDVDKFIPFKERRSADSVNATDGLAMCKHMLAIIDTQDTAKPMWQETIWVPTPRGVTEYTENNHTSREQQPQPMPTAVLDWMTETLRNAPIKGTASATLPLPLALNGNQTVLGLFTGTAKATMTWSFDVVSSAPASTRPAKP